MNLKKLFLIVLVLLGIFLASFGVFQAINSMYKQVTAIGVEITK